METAFFARQFRSEDLPTLGRPTMATTGISMTAHGAKCLEPGELNPIKRKT
jgi:hypothetical protein